MYPTHLRLGSPYLVGPKLVPSRSILWTLVHLARLGQEKTHCYQCSSLTQQAHPHPAHEAWVRCTHPLQEAQHLGWVLDPYCKNLRHPLAHLPDGAAYFLSNKTAIQCVRSNIRPTRTATSRLFIRSISYQLAYFPGPALTIVPALSYSPTWSPLLPHSWVEVCSASTNSSLVQGF